MAVISKIESLAVDVESIADAVLEVLADKEEENLFPPTSAVSSTTASFTVLDSVSVTVDENDLVLVCFEGECSVSNLGSWIGFRLSRDSTALTQDKYTKPESALSSGLSHGTALHAIDSGNSGTYSYRVLWSRLGNGTGYVGRYKFTTLKIRQS